MIPEERRLRVESGAIKVYSSFDLNFYAIHISPVRQFSRILAKELYGDLFIADAAALLHDLGLALYGPEKHNLSGAEEARRRLLEAGCAIEITSKIAQAIKVHNGPCPSGISLEDEVLRSADGMAHISEVFYTFYSCLLEQDYSSAVCRLIEKLEFDFRQKITLPLAREMIAGHYESAMRILKSNCQIGTKPQNI